MASRKTRARLEKMLVQELQSHLCVTFHLYITSLLTHAVISVSTWTFFGAAISPGLKPPPVAQCGFSAIVGIRHPARSRKGLKGKWCTDISKLRLLPFCVCICVYIHMLLSRIEV